MGGRVNQHVAIIRPKANVDPDYLAYSLIAPAVKERLLSLASAGATREALTKGGLERFEIPTLPSSQQQQVGAVLRAYDALIEANRRRTGVLEMIARGLFEEWFLRFRFPGREEVEIADGPEGSLPSGWRKVSLQEIARVNSASINSRSAPNRIGYIDIGSVSPGHIDHVEWQAFAAAPGRARRRVADGSIIWSNVRPNRRSFALVLDPDENTIASTGFSVLDATSVPLAYLYCLVTTDDFVAYLTNHATGAAYPAVSGATFERAIVTVPTPNLLARFSTVAEPAFRMAEKLRRSNRCLSAARDLLLPRLLSGRLTLPAAERELADAA